MIQPEPDMDTVYAALNIVNHQKHSPQIAEASNWLSAMQESIYAWTIADNLLQEKRDHESCFFGAKLLRTKIQTAFDELPIDCHLSLRETIFNLFKVVKGTLVSDIFTSEMGLALADLMFLMTSWSEPVSELISRLKTPDNKCSPSLLQVLTVLPKELNSSDLKLADYRRVKMRKELRASTDDVFHLLNVSLDSLDNEKIMICFGSWTKLVRVTGQQLSNCNALYVIFHELESDISYGPLHETATDTLCSIIQIVADRESSKPTIKMGKLEDKLIAKVRQLHASYRQSAADGDLNKCINYSRIFTEMSKAVLPRIMAKNAIQRFEFMRFIDMVLECTGHGSYGVARVTFGFWYTFCEQFLLHSKIRGTFFVYFDKLIGVLHQHCHMKCGVSTGDQDFNQFRSDVEKLIVSIAPMVNSVSAVRYFSYKVNTSSDDQWQTTEASLFIMQSMAENFAAFEDQTAVTEVAQSIVEALLPRLKIAHPAISKTSLILLGKLRRWMGQTAEDRKSPLFKKYQDLLSATATQCFEMIGRNGWMH